MQSHCAACGWVWVSSVADEATKRYWLSPTVADYRGHHRTVCSACLRINLKACTLLIRTRNRTERRLATSHGSIQCGVNQLGQRDRLWRLAAILENFECPKEIKVMTPKSLKINISISWQYIYLVITAINYCWFVGFFACLFIFTIYNSKFQDSDVACRHHVLHWLGSWWRCPQVSTTYWCRKEPALEPTWCCITHSWYMAGESTPWHTGLYVQWLL